MKIISNLKLFIYFTLILGFVYPLLIFWVGNTAFNKQTHGSIEYVGDVAVGSKLLGQNFTKNSYFHGRPSASSYDGMSSGGSNLSPISKVLKERIEKLKSEGFEDEMLFSSGSGLDPHMSLKSALFQVDKIIQSRKLDLLSKEKLVSYLNHEASLEESRFFGIKKINVLKLNLFLDKEFK